VHFLLVVEEPAAVGPATHNLLACAPHNVLSTDSPFVQHLGGVRMVVVRKIIAIIAVVIINTTRRA
jgi:hypothetical protein